jgi:general secretion pathway protein A
MYLGHFGLREAPFSLTPDPRFLYLGERHREGLAHLRYGLEEGGGFVQLTGEIGTGKTTLCRALLGELPGHLDVAFLLNPRVSEVDLLASLCDELHIPYAEARQKALVDALYGYLLDAHARGRTTVLIIDEAQNLSAPVLEQVRLLTNLETTKKKLLQIILIGQPELLEVLARSELRQLAQRITARYHLVPFSRRETGDYIAHRIEVAGGSPRILGPRACREIYRQSQGVPRLINVFCDRALLGAYVEEQAIVTARTARRAIAEVRGTPVFRLGRVLAAVTGLTAVAAGVIWWYGGRPGVPGVVATPAMVDAGTSAPPPAAAPPPPAPRVLPPAPRPAPPPAPRPAPPQALTAPGYAALMGHYAPGQERAEAYAALLAFFGLEPPVGADDPCEILARDGWRCQWQMGDWAKLERLGRPVLAELRGPSGEARYAALSGLDDGRATLSLGPSRHALSRDTLEAVWPGRFLVLWRPPKLTGRVLSRGAEGSDVLWLREQFRALDGAALASETPRVYDEGLSERVRAFQRSRALAPDAVVGPETLVHLDSALHRDLRGPE